jgi:hypothetical protein
MTTVEVIADAPAAQAAQGLKAVEDTAIATLVRIERAYEEAIAQVAFLATSRARAPQVVEWPQVVAQPAVTPTGEVPPAPKVVAPRVELVPEQRVSPLVEALQALQEAEAEAAAAEPQPVADVAPLPEMVPVGPVTAVVELPRQLDAEWMAGRHAEAKTDEIPVQVASAA